MAGATIAKDGFDWAGPAAPKRRRSLGRVLREAIVPPRGHRVTPTSSGIALVFVGLCLGLAAYNTENNILFAALSLVTASLILSGVVCWVNFSSVQWRLETSPTYRAGEEGEVAAVVKNARERFPVYCLGFDVAFSDGPLRRRLCLGERLDPLEEARLSWTFKPERRCRAEAAIVEVSSSFPFGFLRKHVAGEKSAVVRVWPARIPYQLTRASSGGLALSGKSLRRKGPSGELVGLRDYRSGDPPRSIHWKMSAKQRKLVVKQNAAESQTMRALFVDASKALWSSEATFERLCSFAASLAEDLFLQGRLERACLAGGEWIKTTRVADLESFLDALADLEWAALPEAEPAAQAPAGSVSFAPMSGKTIGAFANGVQIAQA